VVPLIFIVQSIFYFDDSVISQLNRVIILSVVTEMSMVDIRSVFSKTSRNMYLRRKNATQMNEDM